MQWFTAGGRTRSLVPAYMANTGMCRWTERCQSTESRHTRHNPDTTEPLLKGIQFPQIATSILTSFKKRYQESFPF